MLLDLPAGRKAFRQYPKTKTKINEILHEMATVGQFALMKKVYKTISVTYVLDTGSRDSCQYQRDSNGHLDTMWHSPRLHSWHHSNILLGKSCKSFFQPRFGRFHFRIWMVVVCPQCRSDLVCTDTLLVLLCFDHQDSNTVQRICLWVHNFLFQHRSYQRCNPYNLQVSCSSECWRTSLQDMQSGCQSRMDSSDPRDSQTGRAQ